jgi:hypothetical protein
MQEKSMFNRNFGEVEVEAKVEEENTKSSGSFP